MGQGRFDDAEGYLQESLDKVGANTWLGYKQLSKLLNPHAAGG